MSDRGVYALSAAIVAAAALFAFAPARSPAPAVPSAPGPGPIIHSAVHEKQGQQGSVTAIVVAYPDGRYIRWEAYGNASEFRKI
jgi:hypothetical protein